MFINRKEDGTYVPMIEHGKLFKELASDPKKYIIE